MMGYAFVAYKIQTRSFNLKIFVFDFLCGQIQEIKHKALQMPKARSDWQRAKIKCNLCCIIILTFFAVMSDSIALYSVKP